MTMSRSLSLCPSRTETGFQKILQVDLEVEGFLGQLGGRSLTWQVEYPGSRRFTEEVETEVRLAQQELRGIVPLAMVSMQ